MQLWMLDGYLNKQLFKPEGSGTLRYFKQQFGISPIIKFQQGQLILS